jgi:hypothetical protein
MSEFSVGCYAIKCWNTLLKREHDAEIKEELKSVDYTPDWAVDAAHLYLLDNGKYCVVFERGCSCYSYDDADINVVNTLEEAEQLYSNRN